LELFPENRSLRRWMNWLEAHQVPGTACAHCWLDMANERDLGWRFNDLVKKGMIKLLL